MNKLEELGNNIRAERNRLRLSQEQLASLAGIQQPHLGKIEGGEVDVRFSTLTAIIEALNVPFEKLYNIQHK